MDLYLITNLLTVGLQLIFAWIAFRGDAGILPLIYALLAAQVAGAVIAGAFCLKVVPEFRLFARADWPGIARLIRLVWPLALLSVLGVAYQRVGIMALSFLAGDAPTGWFSAASRVVEGLKLVHIAVLGAIFPAISHLSSRPSDGQDQAGTLFRTAFWVLLSLAFLAALLASVMAPFIVGVLFGPAYNPAIPLVRILAWVLVPYTLTSSLSLRMITRGRERSALSAIVAGLTITIGLNYWLIQARNLDGAALAAVLGECILAGIFWALR